MYIIRWPEYVAKISNLIFLESDRVHTYIQMNNMVDFDEIISKVLKTNYFR